MHNDSPTPNAASAAGMLPLPVKSLLGFSFAIVAVAIIAALSYRSLRNTAASSRSLTQSIEVLSQLESTLSTLKDAETGQRGYLLTQEDAYLAPYIDAKANLPAELERLNRLLTGRDEQLRRLDTLDGLARQKMAELESTVAQERAGRHQAALAIVHSDLGKIYMDKLRSIVAEMELAERRQVSQQSADANRAAAISLGVSWGGSGLLILLIGAAAIVASRDHRERLRQSWIRSGQLGIGEAMQGDQTLDSLSVKLLDRLAAYIEAPAAAMYVAEGGQFRRVAAVALAPGEAPAIRPGEGLLGQAAKENRTLHVREVPPDYLPIRSATGAGSSAQLLVLPAAVDGVVYAVLEFGFFGDIRPEQRQLLSRAAESIGVAVRAAKDRQRLEELLQETQSQAEELQAGQEELRVSNEELEEQGRALRESQTNLEHQQAELEQVNSQLEGQTRLLEHQKEALSQAHATLTCHAEELQRANEYKSEFLANMSHELRTPLNSTLILAKLLADNKEGNLTAQQVKFAQTITSAGNDLLALINDVLDLSRIEAGKIDLNIESVTIESLVDSLRKTFQPAADQKRIGFSILVEPGVAQRIDTDGQRLGQILRNLLSNAVKFTEKGEVSLRICAGEGGTVAFAVRDTGVGIAAHQQEVIFEAFRQADGSIHRKFGGTGLGLSISRDLAALLRGSIAVRSELGVGSVFTLVIPAVYTAVKDEVTVSPRIGGTAGTAVLEIAGSSSAPAEELPRAVMPDDRNQIPETGRGILVVEDDPAFAMILRDLVREMGFACIVTGTAGDGLLAANKYQPSAILLDMNLPDHSGLGVLDQLKRNPRTRHIPVHVISVADYKREALELGAVGYVMKPALREHLVEALRRLEAKFSQSSRRVLVVEDDPRQRESMRQLLANDDVQITAVATAGDALSHLRASTFDCMVVDFNLPDYSGYDLLERMARQEEVAFPPVIVYTGRALTAEEEQRLRRFSRSIIIKDVRSPERLLDEVTLFLHQVESKLPPERQRMLQSARNRESALEGRHVLIVEDDVRNIFALTSALEPKGVTVRIARNGREALDVLGRAEQVDLILMDIMMPEMDGLTATREIRKDNRWRHLPIIALTAKAMADDQEKCLAAGANDYIAKPLDVDKLLSLVRVWMPK